MTNLVFCLLKEFSSLVSVFSFNNFIVWKKKKRVMMKEHWTNSSCSHSCHCHNFITCIVLQFMPGLHCYTSPRTSFLIWSLYTPISKLWKTPILRNKLKWLIKSSRWPMLSTFACRLIPVEASQRFQVQ